MRTNDPLTSLPVKTLLDDVCLLEGDGPTPDLYAFLQGGDDTTPDPSDVVAVVAAEPDPATPWHEQARADRAALVARYRALRPLAANHRYLADDVDFDDFDGLGGAGGGCLDCNTPPALVNELNTQLGSRCYTNVGHVRGTDAEPGGPGLELVSYLPGPFLAEFRSDPQLRATVVGNALLQTRQSARRPDRRRAAVPRRRLALTRGTPMGNVAVQCRVCRSWDVTKGWNFANPYDRCNACGVAWR